MTPSRSVRIVLIILFVVLLATPIAIKRLAARREVGNSKLDARQALARYGFYFQEVAHASGIDFVHQAPTLDHKLDHIMPQVAAMGAGASIVDFDRDGWQDIYLTNSGEGSKNCLYRNQGDGTFKDVAAEVGIADLNQPDTGVSMGAVWGDYDNDGYDDLFVYKWGRPELFHNDGGRHFTRVTEQAGLPAWVNANTAIWFDYDGDGLLDLFVGGYYSEDNGKEFREVGEQTGVGFAPKSGMTAAFGDVLNQGKYAVYVSNISEDGVLIQGNNLWVPQEGTSGDGLRYENLARALGVEMGGWSWGMQFGDLNNDGTLDLYLTNGYVSADRNKSYWYDFSKVAGGNSAIIGDAKNWPAMEGRSLSGYQQKRVWVNDGAGKFNDVAQAVGATDTYDGRSVVFADLWNRGVLDVIVTNQRGPLLIYKNTVAPDNKWVDFELEGTASNRSALGAEVKLYWSGQQQVQTVSGGSGFCAENQRRLHFGLGKDPQIERAVIRWPSGKVETIEKPLPGQVNKVKEPA